MGRFSAGNAGTQTVNVSTVAGAVYTGLAIASIGGANYIYAADNTGHIIIFDSNFSKVTGSTFAGKFVDPNSVSGFHPFNIQSIGGNLYVTYAAVNQQGVGLPGGFVDEFDSQGS